MFLASSVNLLDTLGMVDEASIRAEDNICPSDKPVGIVIVIVGILLLVFSGFLNFADTKGTDTVGHFTYTNPSSAVLSWPTPTNTQTILGLFTLFAAVYAIGIIVCGIMVIERNRQAFDIAIVFFALLVLSGGGTSILSLAIVVYSVLRKIGMIKPVSIASQ